MKNIDCNAAVRQVNDDADNEVRATLNNPEAYNTYTSHRAEYGDGPYSAVPERVTTRSGPLTSTRCVVAWMKNVNSAVDSLGLSPVKARSPFT